MGMVMSPEDKNAVLLAAPDRRRLGALPPADLRARRRRLALALVGPQELAGARARAGPPAGRLVGLGAHRHGPAAARDRARLARRLPRRAPDRRGRRCTARASRCSTSSSPRSSCGARRNGCSGPGADYEVSGDVPNVVFPCGLVHHRESDKLFLYYGAADTRIGLATASLLRRHGVPPRLPLRLSPPGHSGTPRVLAPSPCAQQHHAVPLELQQPVPRQPAAEQDLGPTSSAWTPPRRTAPRSPAARAATAAWPPAIGYP